MKTIYQNYRVEYFFNHSTHGFSNSVTVSGINIEDASKKAVNEISDCYGSKMLKRFSFKQPILLSK